MAFGKYSGASPIGLHLTRALAKEHILRAFVGHEARNLSDWLDSGLDVDVRSSYRSSYGAAASLLLQRRIRRLSSAIDAFHPEVVIVPFVHLWTGPLMLRLRGVPWIVCLHDPEPHQGFLGKVWHAIDRRIVRHAEHVIVHSSIFAPTVVARYRVDRSRISIIPIGPLSDYREAKRGESGAHLPAHGPRLLCFGRMAAYKGVEVLIEAMREIVRTWPDAILTIAGSGLTSAIRAKALSIDSIKLHDRWIDDAEIPAFFGNADIVVLPYTSATQSGVIPVAAAFGLPVIASAVGGLPEQLDHGAVGVLVPPGNARALASAVGALWSDPARARALGVALHDAYEAQRSWTSIANAVTDACRTAITGFRMVK